MLHGAARSVSVPQVGPHPGDAAPVRGERADGTHRQRVLVQPAERQLPLGRADRPVERQAVQPGPPVGAHAEHVPGARAGRQRGPEALAVRHRRLERAPCATAGPTLAPVASTPGCWVSRDVEEVAVDARDGALRGRPAGTRWPARPPPPDTAAPSRTRGSLRSTLEHVGVRHPRGRRDVELLRTRTPGASCVHPGAAPAGAAPTRAAPASVPSAARNVSTVLPAPNRPLTTRHSPP